MNKVRIFLFSLCGEFIKLYYSLLGHYMRYGLNKKSNRKERIIVSLTSYGRRVSKILPYALISLLRQTYKPDLILVWLDEVHWNKDNLPKQLQRLQKYGVTVRFCRDIKSYKKLIPTLECYPEDLIITCDDDLYYNKNMIERLMNAWNSNPNRIYTLRAHSVTFSRQGDLLPYNEWVKEIRDSVGHNVFPTGGAGCLYKRSLLHCDICKEELFMKLAPMADDVWFYFMEILKGTQRVILSFEKKYAYIPLDVFYQYLHKTSNLSNFNCKESQNDLQIQNIMNYYKLHIEDLK